MAVSLSILIRESKKIFMFYVEKKNHRIIFFEGIRVFKNNNEKSKVLKLKQKSIKWSNIKKLRMIK